MGRALRGGRPPGHRACLSGVRRAFINGFPEDEARRLYERYHIPASGEIFWGSALASIHPGKDDNWVNYRNTERAPLLFISGSTDHLMPPSPCRHGARVLRPLVGDVIGFALRHEGRTVWISGDTVMYDGVRSVAERLHVDTTILHLGAVRFPVTGPLRYTLTAREAVELCRIIRPLVIPIHYEGWSHFREGREAIERELERAPDIRGCFRWLPIGEPVEV